MLGLHSQVVSEHVQEEDEESNSFTVFIPPHSQSLIRRDTSGTF